MVVRALLTVYGVDTAWCRYVVRACEAAKSDDPTHAQRVVYLSVRRILDWVHGHAYSSQIPSPPERTRAPPFSIQGNPPLSHPPDTHLPVVHRSKGLTELGLARLGYADTIVFRPGYLRGAERPEKRYAESVLGYVAPPSVSCVVSPLG